MKTTTAKKLRHKPVYQEDNKMKNVVVNNDMNLMIPEGFAEISRADAEAMTVCKGPAPMWNIFNEEEHVLITASWIKAGWIVSHLYNAKDMAKSLLNQYKSGLKVESPYACTYSDISETTLDGNKAYTYSCTYRALTKSGKMMDMIRETVVVKIKDVFYVFQSVCRNELKEAGVESFHMVYDSVQFAAAA